MVRTSYLFVLPTVQEDEPSCSTPIFLSCQLGQAVSSSTTLTVTGGGAKAAQGGKLRRIIELLLEQQFASQRHVIATDYKKFLISPVALVLPGGYVNLQYKNEGEDLPAPRSPTYRVMVQHRKTLAMADLLAYLCSTDPAAAYANQNLHLQALQILTTFPAKQSTARFTVASNKIYTKDAAAGDTFTLEQNLLMAQRGYFISVRAAAGRILLNTHVIHGVFYPPGPLVVLMREYINKYGIGPSLDVFLQKLRITTTHLPKKINKAGTVLPRYKTIIGLAKISDGRKSNGESQARGPSVPFNGANSNRVRFYLEKAGRLVSITEYFRRGKSMATYSVGNLLIVC